MDLKFNAAIISENESIRSAIRNITSESGGFTGIDSFESELAFLASAEEAKHDVIIVDFSKNNTGWKDFSSSLKKILPNSRIILVATDDDKELLKEMISSDVYDIVSPRSLTRLISILSRLRKDNYERAQFLYLTKEKDFSDHIVNNSRSMLSIINSRYEYEKVNTAFCVAQKLDPSYIIGKTLPEVWGDETFKKYIKSNIDLCLSGNTVRYEANFDTPSRGRRIYEVIFRPIPDSDGQITHLLAETFDITDLRESQLIVSEMENEFRKLETNLPIGFLRCDTEGNIVNVNKAFLKIMECDDEASIVGLNIGDFYADGAQFRLHMAQLKREKVVTFGRIPLYTSTGNEIACKISGFVVATESCESEFIDFAWEDSSRELMLENRLLQAHKLETIGSLAGGLAHDFNNILATISGYSELLLDDVPPGSKSYEKLGKILNAVTRARSLTNQILTFSRQVEQEKIHVKTSEVLRETVGFVSAGMQRNISVKADIAQNDGFVFADPTQLFRVFLNLMTNAVQSMEEKGGTLVVGLQVVDGSVAAKELTKDIIADEYVAVRIEDSGTGMDPSVLNRIFEPYFTTKEVGRGTGLGLSVVHGIISEIAGEILVSSKKNIGSVFTVYIPVSKMIGSDLTGQSPARNIMFVSGNKHESKILAMALENRGYTIITSEDISMVPEKASSAPVPPELIIVIDDQGKITAEELHSLRSKPQLGIPLILITDNENFMVKENILNSGLAKQVLVKPVSLKDIHNAIKLILN
ncbi:MAG: ATP-binding protein [Bacteroidales bacterium]